MRVFLGLVIRARRSGLVRAATAAMLLVSSTALAESEPPAEAVGSLFTEAEDALAAGQPLLALRATHRHGDRDRSPAWLSLRGRAYVALGEPLLGAWQARAADTILENSGYSFEESEGGDEEDLDRLLDSRVGGLGAPLAQESSTAVAERLLKYGQAEGSVVQWSERAEAYWLDGDCRGTVAAAGEWAYFRPEEPRAHLLLGDALRCVGSPRSALDAYRTVAALGASYPALQEIVSALKDALVTLSVRISVPEGAELPDVLVAYRGGVLPVALADDGTGVVPGLPWEQALAIEVSGQNYRVERHRIRPIPMNSAREFQLEVEVAERGAVQLVELPQGIQVLVRLGNSWERLSVSRSVQVPAGVNELRIQGPGGTTGTAVDVIADGLVQFDPRPWLPASVRIEGLPAGAVVRLFVEGLDGATANRSLFVPPRLGTLDESTGVLVADPVVLRGLVVGPAGVFVDHLQLGETAGATSIASGTSNLLNHSWRSMTGVPLLAHRYGLWKEERGAIIQRARRAEAASVVATVAAGVASVALFGAAVSAGKRMDEARAIGLEAAQDDDLVRLAFARNDNLAWSEAQRAFLTGATAGVAGLALGVALTFKVSQSGRAELAEFGDWGYSQRAP